MLNSAAIGTVRFEQTFLTTFEVIFERLTADAADNHFIFVKAFEQNDVAHRVMLCIFTRKEQLSFVQHSEHTKYAAYCRPMHILLAAFEARYRWRADTGK